MNHFWRAVRLALAYRWTIIASVVCALAVGVLWGANIATIKPFVEVAFNGRSLQQWVHSEIETAEQHIAELSSKIDDLQEQLESEAQGADSLPLESELAQAQTQLETEQDALAGSLWIKPYIEQYLPAEPFPTLLVIAGVLLAGTLLKVTFLIGNTIAVNRVAHLATLDLRKQLYRRTLKMHPAAFDAEGTGELMSRFTFDMENVFRGLHTLFGKAVREPLKMVACLIGAAFICWRLLFLSLVLAPLAIYLVRKLAQTLKRANRRAMEDMSKIYSLLEESFQGIRVVQAFTMERAERNRFHRSNKNYFLRAMRIARYESLTRPLTELTGVATILVALLCGAFLVLQHETHLWGIRICERPLSLSSLLLFYGLLSGVSDPARKLSEVFSRLQRAAAAAERIYDLMDRKSMICDPKRPKPLVRHHRELELRNVHFHYKPGTPVLTNINLRISTGETIALVGPNGCGKSTLVNLLPRFYDPTQGQVLLDGIDVREVRLRDLRRQLGLVAQNSLLFDDTVFNNIRYGCPHATREEVIAAAKRAHAHAFIEEQLSDGYETIAGSQGNLLSGGQRQRVALARAILRNPSVLILDEATSQIDMESEHLIHKVLESFIKNRTTILIIHRLSTLALAERIVVMEAGQIIATGRHDELLKRCSLYRRLYDVQFQRIA